MPRSTGDEFCALPQCLHHKDDHDRDGCRTCPGDDERSWNHKYVPQDATTGVVTVAGRLVNRDALDPDYQPTPEHLAKVSAFLDGTPAEQPAPDAFDRTGTGIRILRDQEANRYRHALDRMTGLAKSVTAAAGERPPLGEIEQLAHAIADLLRAAAAYDMTAQLHAIHTAKDDR